MIQECPIFQLKAWSFHKNRCLFAGAARSRTLSMDLNEERERVEERELRRES
ncbi:hypothetical protein CLDAP_39070 [Caldilinea aerophila DSM 14535 = NBRC 104270]|uniref:Uncharacterized protein n=1 Tax=Caldilinea aerophila (strain DSM 14535 / JCM 11387 / NBRC 104270 / STL-6-O1) TaxID=926550 RepID=I0I9K9_CALAS|nr:hypothetical protein CLDAP_39070 [Caldilinea aerophila DSM 14535 = NBRC 104270]